MANKPICYCASVSTSKLTAEEFNLNGISAAHIDGDTPKQERTEIIEKFRNKEIKVLTNCEILGEGLDVQGCEVCILLRPTESLSLYIPAEHEMHAPWSQQDCHNN